MKWVYPPPTKLVGLSSWLLFLASLLLTGVPAYADLTTGLIAYYPFTGNANDVSGNGYHGTVTGAMLTTDRLGSANAAYNFDVGSYINATLTSINTSNGAQITVSFWMNWTGKDDAIPIQVYQSGCGLILYNGYFGFNTCNDYDIYGISSSGLANRWVNVTAIFTNGNVTQGKIYIDGVIQSSSQLQGSPDTTNSLVGQSFKMSSVYEYFLGKLDDVRVYNRALTAAEVQEIYQISPPGPAPTLGEALDNSLTWTTSGSANWFAQTAITHDGIDAAQSGDISDSQTSKLETTVTGPGDLSFYWKVSSESGYDYLSFYMDNVAQAYISGTVDWQQKTFSIPTGSHSVAWVYSKDSTSSGGSADTGWVDQVIFTPAGPSAPLVSTNAATAVTANSTTLNGSVTPNGVDTIATFDFGTTTAYGTSIAATPNIIFAAASESSISAAKTGLTCGTTYHYRVKAANSVGTTLGTDKAFTTEACPTAPVVSTDVPSLITATSAILKGTVNPKGAATTVTFDFGTTTTYGQNNLAATPASIAATATATSVGVVKAGLTCGTTYHYRVKAVNSVGTTLGADKAFTTNACPVDFIITNAVLTPVSPVANATFSAAVTVKNQGPTAGDGGQLRLWANQPTVQVCAATGGDKNIAVGAIAAGASKVLNLTGINAGIGDIKTLRALVDATCVKVETNETNNQFTKTYRVTGKPDFVVTSMTVTPATPAANGNFTLAVIVKNQGTAAGDGGFLDVWHNLATVPACGTEGTAWADVGVVAAGATKTLTLSLPAGVAGAKTARAFVDSWCETVESNKANNQLIKAYIVQ